jgi:hypothetical protein
MASASAAENQPEISASDAVDGDGRGGESWDTPRVAEMAGGGSIEKSMLKPPVGALRPGANAVRCDSCCLDGV